MKILLILIFTLNLISGPVGCLDVIGYPGGSVIIYCEDQQSGQSGQFNKYFCKEKTGQCIHAETQNSWIHKDRFSLVAYSKSLRVIYRDLSVEDAGLYQCGETGVWNHTVNLRVKTDPCCSGSKTVIGYPGGTITFNCSYPEEFQENLKYFDKLSGQLLRTVIDTIDVQEERFSMSDNRRSRVLSVRISDVRKDDGGVYYCGAGIGREPVSYDTFFTKIHLQVSAAGSSTSTTTTIIIIAVSICMVLLLIG